MSLVSDLYYECHITVEPLYDERLEEFKDIANRHQFRVAELLMKKRATETLEPSTLDSFCTGRSKEYTDLWTRMTHVIDDLRVSGIRIWRYKIEDTLLDSRINDVLGLIPVPDAPKHTEG